jgi:hypothetical protein
MNDTRSQTSTGIGIKGMKSPWFDTGEWLIATVIGTANLVKGSPSGGSHDTLHNRTAIRSRKRILCKHFDGFPPQCQLFKGIEIHGENMRKRVAIESPKRTRYRASLYEQVQASIQRLAQLDSRKIELFRALIRSNHATLQ